MARTVPPQLETDPPVVNETSVGFYSPAETSSRVMSPSLPEAHRTIAFTAGASWFRKVFAFAGPGYLVAVGYMDPGNWATDIAGGSKFAYSLLCEIAIAACDLAEVLGSAVALKLLFGLPLLAGVLITAFDVLIVLALQGRG